MRKNSLVFSTRHIAIEDTADFQGSKLSHLLPILMILSQYTSFQGILIGKKCSIFHQDMLRVLKTEECNGVEKVTQYIRAEFLLGT